MDWVRHIFHLAAIGISCFSLGYSFAMAHTSSYEVRKKAEKLLDEALRERCQTCQKKSEITIDAKDVSKAAIDR